MATLTRVSQYTVASASVLNSWATEIERVEVGTFGSLSNTAKPLVKAIRTSVYTVAASTDVVIPWQSADDPTGMWDAGTPTRLTVNTAGLLLCIAQLRWPNTTATGVRNSVMMLNGTTPLTHSFANDSRPGSTTGDGPTNNYAALIRCVIGDALYLNAYQTSGGSMDLQTNYGSTTFSVG